MGRTGGARAGGRRREVVFTLKPTDGREVAPGGFGAGRCPGGALGRLSLLPRVGVGSPWGCWGTHSLCWS